MFFCSIYIICSIFRLARFSSLKHAGVTDYVGLPITVSGPLLSLFVLCNNIFIFLCSIVCLSILMVINIKVKKINLGE
jgi:phosphatidylserine synthase